LTIVLSGDTIFEKRLKNAFDQKISGLARKFDGIAGFKRGFAKRGFACAEELEVVSWKGMTGWQSKCSAARQPWAFS
jgi:hypothetical protein